MKNFMISIILLSTVWVHAASWQMVLDATEEKQRAEEVKKRVEVLFKTDPQARRLQKKYQLEVRLERLDRYTLAVIAPITVTSLKNELNLIFRPHYPSAFIVEQWPKEEAPEPKTSVGDRLDKQISNPLTNKPEIKERKSGIVDQIRKKSFIRGLDNEWLALIVLAILGLLLVMRSAYQIKKIKTLQRALEETQKRNSKYLNTMGREYA